MPHVPPPMISMVEVEGWRFLTMFAANFLCRCNDFEWDAIAALAREKVKEVRHELSEPITGSLKVPLEIEDSIREAYESANALDQGRSDCICTAGHRVASLDDITAIGVVEQACCFPAYTESSSPHGSLSATRQSLIVRRVEPPCRMT